ncbi:hypothetical protein CONPUDRAFT_154882 [Coniophora puteana RWD-64-598 SS2]|uniref:VWA-like protein n=1 Tax=Coniophora puteana (strain RWD-64-598) TaxID=741705 RepID=A0A5M3MKB8_CONPW|nr:uncharacterized protein CONPUDRAFT_154882 [Coniophora puteana RWD-64-598 SS2]EIW79467.1 hypothetical protein CONPUDRAFT_154882 [Coniophora puteana RWD-64-598 SS2]
MTTQAGIFYRSSPDPAQPGNSGTVLRRLELESVDMPVWVVDVGARVALTQTFRNPPSPTGRATGRAKYVFPLPARASVCAFELERGDGRGVRGEARERAEAEEVFGRAVREGREAGLVEWVTDDVFTISVGSVPSGMSVVTRLVFVMDLLDEGIRDHIRLQLPTAVAPRYGPAPAAILDASSASASPGETRLTIRVDVQTSEEILALRSPTHPITLLRYKTRSGRRSTRRMSASWASPEFLAGDFVLSIHARGLDAPRCFASRHPTDAHGAVAMHLTLVPTFSGSAPRAVRAQEYVFVVDRSGSMGGAPMETAKRTLAVLLRALPARETRFNVVSFGSHVDGLWPQSVVYAEETLGRGIAHVESMGADYGGTEMANALRFALDRRDTSRPTAVFFLTDGGVTDVQGPADVVKAAVQASASTPAAPLRVFVLGIGPEVSSDVCERIARAGEGECLFALHAEEITGRCARLLNAGRTRTVESVEVDWNCDARKRRTRAGGVRFDSAASVGGGDVQQAPHQITRVFPDMRLAVSALTTFDAVPKNIRLHARFRVHQQGAMGNGEEQETVELDVPVTEIIPFSKNHDTSDSADVPLLHALAARRLITEIEENRTPPPRIKPDVPTDPATVRPEPTLEEAKRAAVVHLGVRYQLASKYTSFVAVDEGTARSRVPAGGRSRFSFGRSMLARRLGLQKQKRNDESASSSDWEDSAGAAGPDGSGDDLLGGILDGLTNLAYGAWTMAFGPPYADTSAPPVGSDRGRLPGGLGDINGDTESVAFSFRTESSGARTTQHRYSDASGSDSASVRTFSTLSSLTGSSSSSRWTRSRTPSPPRHLHIDDDPVGRVPSPVFGPINLAPSHIARHHHLHTQPPPQTHPPPAHPRTPLAPSAQTLLALQSFDGSFPPSTCTPHLAAALGHPALARRTRFPADRRVSERVWATVLALVWVCRALARAGEDELGEVVRVKGVEWLEESGEVVVSDNKKGEGRGSGGRGDADVSGKWELEALLREAEAAVGENEEEDGAIVSGQA